MDNREKRATAKLNKAIVEDYTRRLLAYYSDPDKKERKKQCICKYHYYFQISRIGGQAVTQANCSECGKEMTFGNTCIDRLCPECAQKNNACRHCGGTLD